MAIRLLPHLHVSRGIREYGTIFNPPLLDISEDLPLHRNTFPRQQNNTPNNGHNQPAMSEPNRPLNPPVKKRRRPALSCEQCRRRKVRCDRGSPCATCVQTGNKTCSYAAPPRPRATHPRVIWPSPPESSEASPDGTGGAPEADVGAEKPTPSQGSSNVDWVFGRTLLHSGDSRAADTAIDVKSLTERIRDLEWQVQTGRPAPGLKRVEKGGNAPLRGMLEKTRFFGPSHWSNAVQLVRLLRTLPV